MGIKSFVAFLTFLLLACGFTPPSVQGANEGAVDASSPVPGDTCANAIDLGSMGDEEMQSTPGDTTPAVDDLRTNQLGCPGGDPGSGNHNDLFYRVRFEDNDRVRVTLTTTGWNPALVVLKGDCSDTANGSDVAFCSSNNTGAAITTPLFDQENGTYHIWVDGRNGGNGSEGPFTLSIERRE